MNGERDRGILSPADRAYLRGESDLGSVQSERNTRSRIRQRVYDGMLDFEVLLEELEDRDRRLVFEGDGDADETATFDAIVAAIAFLYRATGDADIDFETVLREGINVAEATEDRAATVRLDLTFRRLTADELLSKLERGERLSLTELAYLHESDDVTRRELARYFADREGDPTEIDDGRIQAKVTDF